MTKYRAVASMAWLGLLAPASCTSTSAQPGNDAAAGAAGEMGVGGAAGAGAGGAGMIGGPSGLPVPPGPGGVAQPTGTPGNLHVLDWAGFKSAVTYTFDDAQPSQIEHYAELQATGARLTFYITSGNSGDIAGFDATFTQAVTDGHEMGNHTVHHCHADLTGCSTGAGATPRQRDRRLHQLHHRATSASQRVWTAASPYGDTGYDTPDTTRFFLNRGVGSGIVAPIDNTDPFNLPCHAAVDGETVDSFNTAIDGATHDRPLADLPGSHASCRRRRTGTRRSTSRWSPAASRTRSRWATSGSTRWSTSAPTGARRRWCRPRRRPPRAAQPDLDLDAAGQLPARQVRAGHRRRRHALAERHDRAVGRPRLLRDRARRRIADGLPVKKTPKRSRMKPKMRSLMNEPSHDGDGHRGRRRDGCCWRRHRLQLLDERAAGYRRRHRHRRRHQRRHRRRPRSASWRRACAGSAASTPRPTPRTRASPGRAPASWRASSGTSLTAQLAITGTTQIFKTVIDGTPQAPFTAGGRARRTYPLATGLAAGRSHRRALPADRRVRRVRRSSWA